MLARASTVTGGPRWSQPWPTGGSAKVFDEAEANNSAPNSRRHGLLTFNFVMDGSCIAGPLADTPRPMAPWPGGD